MISYWKRTTESGATGQVVGPATDTWAYVTDPTDAELDALVADGVLERDLLQDAIDPNEVPRVQHERGVTYFFLRAPSGQAEGTQTVPLLIALAPTFLLTVSRAPFTWLERFRGEETYSTAWRSQLVWRIFLALAGRYQTTVTDIARRVRSNVGVSQSIHNEDIFRLVAYEGVLNDMLAALVPTSAILAGVATGKHMKIYEEDKDLMEDVVLSVGQVIEAAKAQLKTTVNYREAYSVIATNNLNRIIKFLTLVTVVLTVPMVVSGLYGMNVRLPLGDHPYAFGFIVTGTIAVVIGLLRVLSAKRLL
ncbi:MAG: magnesium transporter CorA family protein [Candidatus Yanofskybacteria bacterium]|nr:magnesium transporter CorA family protein [Candidatus Yanofskybacteria bacterium]